MRLGIHVSLRARQAVRGVRAALGLAPIALNKPRASGATPLEPGRDRAGFTRSPEHGGGLGASFEPGQTILRVAGQIEGLPQRAGARPSAYAVSFLGPGALSWLPALWVSADRHGASRFGGPRHLAVAGLEQGDAGQLAHPTATAPNLVAALEGEDDDLSEHDDVLRTTAGMTGGPVQVCAWDKVSWGAFRKKTYAHTS